jgi:hypothetical protein
VQGAGVPVCAVPGLVRVVAEVLFITLLLRQVLVEQVQPVKVMQEVQEKLVINMLAVEVAVLVR